MPNQISSKKYKCTRCGHISEQSTNHYGATWSFDHYNCCEKCSPYAKYPEFGGQTLWECMETPVTEQDTSICLN